MSSKNQRKLIHRISYMSQVCKVDTVHVVIVVDNTSTKSDLRFTKDSPYQGCIRACGAEGAMTMLRAYATSLYVERGVATGTEMCR